MDEVDYRTGKGETYSAEVGWRNTLLEGDATRPVVSPHGRAGLLGALVCDLTAVPTQPVGTGTKVVSEFYESLGGAACNEAKAMSGYGGHPETDLLIGKNASAELVDQILEQIPQARLTHAYEKTRQSVHIAAGKTYTSRPPLIFDALPAHLRESIAAQDITIVAPAAAADIEFIKSTLAAANYSVLQLSSEQLADKSVACVLMERADVIVLNHEEAQRLSGESELVWAIVRLLEMGANGVVVTDPHGALARIGGDWFFAPSYQVEVKETVGAGDCFVAILVLAWLNQKETPEALELGQAAAARHIAGLPPCGSLDELSKWAADQPRNKQAFEDVVHPWSSSVRAGAASLAGAAATTLSLLAVFS